MNKLFSLILCVSMVTLANGQDLARRIPSDAFAVVNIQTAHFFDLMGVEDFNQSAIGSMLLEKARSAGFSSVNSVADFGLDLNRTSYFYTVLTDSTKHYNFLVPIADATVFEQQFIRDEEVEEQDGFRSFVKVIDEDTTIFAWDSGTLSVTSTALVDGYFEQSEVADRYGIRNYNYYDYYDDAAADTASAVDYDDYGYYDSTAVAVAVAPDYDDYDDVDVDTARAFEEGDKYDDSMFLPPPALDSTAMSFPVPVDAAADSAWSGDTVYELSAPPAVEYDSADYDDGNPYDEYYAADQQIKKGLTTQWSREFTANLFNQAPAESILSNASYVSSVQDDALITAWLSNFESAYLAWLPELMLSGSTGSLFSHYGSLRAGLYANDVGFRLSTDLEIAPQLAKSYKRIYGRKINRKFLNYLNSEEAIGWFAFAMDTKAYLEELPSIMKDTYGSLLGQHEQEITLAADVVSLLLDEAAIARVAKGDALFVLNGITEEEVPYIDYEYDDNYDYKEVEKTKMETIPDFLLMFSSDDNKLYDQVTNYIYQKGLVSETDGIFSVEESDLPFGLYFTRRDGIIFLGTSSEQMHDIAANRYRGKISRAHRNLIRKNKVAGLLSAKKLATEIPTEELQSLNQYIAFHKLFGSMGDFYFQSKGITGTHITGDFVAETPAEFDNAVQYFFALVDYAMQDQ
ncbi:hypothetical protein [Parapedobacter lycopersici]|uniref:hypothetical protein n=1 Tax=Parapedobacter lycopersici TaxID=1864939 RepID=UPI00214D2D5A|nr:hypothetical protein [Parapedobacter lycopersici]